MNGNGVGGGVHALTKNGVIPSINGSSTIAKNDNATVKNRPNTSSKNENQSATNIANAIPYSVGTGLK